VAAALFWPVFGEAELYISLDAVALMDLLRDLSGRMLVGVLAVVSVIAALDYLYQRFEFTKSMRMSRQELKDELKQTEGDPHVKARLRQIRMERARRRMMAAVPDADVVITNPTHFAVALVYDMETMAAPRLVAKGTDRIALRIREVAEEHDVPVVENPPLARALHAGVELDAEVSPEHYKAVAEVIGYVMRLRGERPPVPRGRGR
jgi:flagellar biosynthetic protein FlhB